ncbi:MAG TPA: hypothetical protein VHY08_09260, partial [Bacillota bacterium]|nr:hypothetical protein [Bacillota bacterium]
MNVAQRRNINGPKWFSRPKVLRPKVFIIISAILLIFLILTVGAYFLVQGQVLTGQIQAALQKSLQNNHLQIEIEEIHFSLRKGVTGTGIRLKELGGGLELIAADEVNLKFNLWELLINPRHPEACLREIEIVKPRMTVERLPGDLWNFQRYFQSSENVLQFKTMIRLQGGLIKYRDFQYGSCEVTDFNGKVNLTQYPLIRWSVGGKAQLALPVSLTSQGEMRADQIAGSMKVFIGGGSLPQIFGYLPRVVDCRIVSGITDINLQMAWGSGAFWLENGKAVIRNANVYLPHFPTPFRVKNLETIFSPERFQIKKAEITYQQTSIAVRGVFNPQNSGIEGAVKVKGLNLKDILYVKPELMDYGLEGALDLNLKISGRISAPVLDGVITIDGAKVVLGQGESIERISGRLAIRRNNLVIQQLRGYWR